MPQERAEKRIDQLTELSTVNSGVKIPGEYNGEAYYFEAGKLKSLVGISDSVKSALLTLAQKVAYIDENGQTYYDALYAALYPPASVTRITAVFSQGNNVIYDTDSLDTLKQYLVVTASYDDGTSATVTTYTLSGTLTEGTSTITATYGGKAAQFNVTVTHRVWAVTSIDAVFNQGSATIYSNQSLDSLRQYLTVNATFENGDTSAVSDYTLSGTLTAGTSTITASYGGKTDTFTVTVTEAVATLLSISAVFTQGDNVIYDTDSLDTLKQYLVVTAHYDDNTDTVVNDYTLSGTLTVGTSTVTVSFGGKTTTFNATVSEKMLYSLSDGDLTVLKASLSWSSNNGIYINSGQSNKRRSYVLLDGVVPMTDSTQGYADTGYFPIPIPASATGVTVSIDPNTQFCGCAFYKLANNVYTRELDPGWKQGSYTYNFTAGQYQYMTATSKYDSAGTGYPEEPTDLSIHFLTE